MDGKKKNKPFKLLLLGWLVIVSCKMPTFVSGLGDAIEKMFRSIARGIRF